MDIMFIGDALEKGINGRTSLPATVRDFEVKFTSGDSFVIEPLLDKLQKGSPGLETLSIDSLDAEDIATLATNYPLLVPKLKSAGVHPRNINTLLDVPNLHLDKLTIDFWKCNQSDLSDLTWTRVKSLGLKRLGLDSLTTSRELILDLPPNLEKLILIRPWLNMASADRCQKAPHRILQIRPKIRLIHIEEMYWQNVSMEEHNFLRIM